MIGYLFSFRKLHVPQPGCYKPLNEEAWFMTTYGRWHMRLVTAMKPVMMETRGQKTAPTQQKVTLILSACQLLEKFRSVLSIVG